MDRRWTVRRCKNYSKLEAKAFQRCLARFRHIIEDKTASAVSYKAKAEAWEELTAIFNTIPGVEQRNSKQLITYYKNMKKRRNMQMKKTFLIKVEDSPTADTSSNPAEERVDATKIPLIKSSSSDESNKMKNSEPSPCEKSCDQEDLFETIEVQCATADELACLKDFDPSELSYIEIPVALIPDMFKQGSLPSSSGEIHTLIRAALNPSIPPSNSSIPPSNSSIPPSNSSIPPSISSIPPSISSIPPSISSIPPSNSSIPPSNSSISRSNSSIPTLNPSISPNETDTSSKKLYQWGRVKKPLLAPGKEAEEKVKRQILMEEHEWDWERFNMEKEKRVLEMKLMKEQLKMYEIINERIDKGEGIQISININK